MVFNAPYFEHKHGNSFPPFFFYFWANVDLCLTAWQVLKQNITWKPFRARTCSIKVYLFLGVVQLSNVFYSFQLLALQSRWDFQMKTCTRTTQGTVVKKFSRKSHF